MKNVEPPKRDVCAHCGAKIVFIKMGVDSYKWVANPDRPYTTWKCKPNAQYPVRSHKP